MTRPQINFICSVPDCGKPAHAKGWCRTHWTRMHLYGRLEKVKGLIKGTCTVEGCEAPIKGKGYCVNHYQLHRRNGTTDKLIKNKRKHPYYSMWFERRRANDLCDAWLELDDFAAGIGEKPEGSFVLVKLNSELEYGPDNFKWQETLKRDDLETDKEWWARKWADTRVRNPDVEYERNLQRSFGISLDDYLEKFTNQSGKCAICKQSETSISQSKTLRRLAVDHCHTTGKIRELLCNRCNTTIGRVGDNPELLIKMANYIIKHKEN